MDKQKALDRLRQLHRRQEALEAEVDGLVAMLKSTDFDGHCEATWAEIGDALGITRQSAQARYSEFSWHGEALA